MIVPPFWSIPVRAPTSPLTTRSPPEAPPPPMTGVALHDDDAGHHVLGDDQPTRPVISTSGPSIRPQPK